MCNRSNISYRDFNFQNTIVTRKENEDLEFIFTGLQIINPKVFSNTKDQVFSMNKVWNQLIQNEQLFALESNINFLHVSTLDVYKKLNIK